MAISLQPKLVVVPTIARRNFLRQGALTCAAAGLFCRAETLTFGQSLETPAQDSHASVTGKPSAQLLLRSKFTPHLSEYFETATDSGESVILLLLEISDLPTQAKLFATGELPEEKVQQLREASFSLLFRGPHEWPLPQRIYHLAHRKLGKLELFLVPVEKVGKDAGWRLYEAVFNRAQ